MTTVLIAAGVGCVAGVLGTFAVPWLLKKFQGLLK
jgi:hypothetical protein